MYFRQQVATAIAEFLLDYLFWTASFGTWYIDTFKVDFYSAANGLMLLKSEELHMSAKSDGLGGNKWNPSLQKA